MQQAVPPLRFATARLATGPQVHYTEQGDPGGEPILFLPAYADSWFSFSRVLSLLPARYHAYAMDQRGHGDSERPACCYDHRRLRRRRRGLPGRRRDRARDPGRPLGELPSPPGGWR